MAPKLLVLSLVFLTAQVFAPTLACDKKPAPPSTPSPSPSTDPWANAPVIEQMTTADGVRIGVQVIVTGVRVPWSLNFAPDGRLFFTERTGSVRIVKNGVLLTAPALTLGDVRPIGEGGLLGLALHPDFATNRLVYLAYTARRADGVAVNRVMRFRETADVLGEGVVLLDDIAAADTHDGARVRFGPDRKLYVTIGDANILSLPQSLSSYNGKILRLNDDGTTPSDNPFGSPIWSWGHRHPQGIDWHPISGQAWGTEHGATGNDELNIIERGANYGWPVIQGAETRPDMVAPILHFTPAIAPSGMSFYRGSRIPAFANNIFFATLRGMHVHRVRLDPANPRAVLANERLFEGRFGRLRDVVSGPDGWLYFCNTNRDGFAPATADDDRIFRIVMMQ